MSRASSLTEQQWQDVERRTSAGASKRALASEFGVSASALREMLARRAMRPERTPVEPPTAQVSPCPMARAQTKNRTHKRPNDSLMATEESAEPVMRRAGAVERHLAPGALLIESAAGLMWLAASTARGAVK